MSPSSSPASKLDHSASPSGSAEGTEININGAVRRPGKHVLAAPATIAAAVMTAGGLARSRRMWASGALTIRRPQANKEEQVWQYDMIEQPISEWGQFELQAGDLVMLQWHIEER